jgi:hypothetical protein
MRQGIADPWLRPTLLGAAFDAGDIDKATQFVREVGREGPVAWQLQSTLSDLKVSTRYVKDEAMRARFVALLAKLELLLT